MLGLLPAVTCLLFFSQPGSSSTSDGDGTVVKTTSGPIQGRRLSAGSGTVTAFLGIPYAEPPLEALRFQKPLPHKPWTNILDTTSFRSPCPQPPLIGWPDSSMWMPKTPYSEDCLFLNIWVPHPRPSSPVPILIWIHGGGFFMSASSVDLYDGRYLATTESVIVASINYRLGALGFLSLPPAAPGNAGLWDQQLALHWLRDNAAAFGGDLNRLTLFGQSAGGASIDFHLLSPSSRPLFSRAVIQSGASSSTWAWIDPEEARQRVQALGLLLGCPEANDIALVRCLQGKEVGEILKHQKSIGRRQSLIHLSFVPTTDGDFLPDAPWKLVKAGHNQSMPILVGFTTNEGSNLLISSYFPFDLEDASQIGREKLLKVLGQMLQGTPEHVIEAIALQYSPAEQGTTRYRWAMEQIINDMLIACGVVDVAQRESEAQSPVYAYTFGYRPRKLSSPEWTGVPHGSDLLFLFGTQAAGNQNFTEAEAALSRRVMWYWAEFARSGNPTGAGSSGEQWPPYTTTEQNFLRISMEEPRVASPSPAQRCGFLMPLIMKQLEVPTGSSLPRTSTSSVVCLDGKAHFQNSAPWILSNPRAEETCEELRPM